MDKDDPGKSVSRSRVVPIKIDSIYIDFRCYTKQQDGGSSHNHSPNRNTLVEPSKSADDSANKKEIDRKIRGDFNMRSYVAEKNREQDAERGELLALQPNSNEALANMDDLPNSNKAPASIDESPNLNEAPDNMDELPNTNEAPVNMDVSPHLNEAPANIDELPDSNEAPANMDESPNINDAQGNMNELPTSNAAPDYMDELPNSNEAPSNMDKSLTCANKIGTANPSSIDNTNVTTGVGENEQMEKNTLEDVEGALSLSEGLGHVHIREENPVATEVRNAKPPFTKNWVRKKKRSRIKRRKVHLLSHIYKNAKPAGETNCKGTDRSTTTFQVVNVIEDFKSEEEEEEESSNIRIRRRKHAKKAIDINEGDAGKK